MKSCLLILIITAFSLPLSEFSMSAHPEPQKKVALFFDDGWKNQYDEAFPVLKNFGFKATFAVITDYIGLDRGTLLARMNQTELMELQKSGMEIASHTKTHPHMLNLTHERLIDEITNSKKALTQLGFNVKTFVYPHGEWNQTLLGYVKEAGYTCARTIKPEAYILENQDANTRYHIGSWPITNQTLEEFKKILNNANESNVIVLTYHHIADEGPEETGTPTQNFQEQMRYLKENNFEVVLLSEILNSDENPAWSFPQLKVTVIGVLAAICIALALRKWKQRRVKNTF